MKSRSGQVALYLVLVLVAIAVFVLMNVNTYLAVTAKNKAMNAGDAAAIAVARYQGELLYKIGERNREHLKLLMPRLIPKGTLEAEKEKVQAEIDKILHQQRRIAFLDPLHGITLGNDAARKVGVKSNSRMAKILRDHVNDIRTQYQQALEIYPEPWEGAWEEYAVKLGTEIGSGVFAGPDNIDFRDASGSTLLTRKAFYNAVAGRCWCWFYFHAQSVLMNYSSFNDWPRPEPVEPQIGNINSEIYSLDVTEVKSSVKDLFPETWMLAAALGYEPVRLPEQIPEDYEIFDLTEDTEQSWICYDEDSHWRNWWEIDPDGTWQFPVVGKVKDIFNVRGCAAVCRVYEPYRDLLWEDYTDESGAEIENSRGNRNVVDQSFCEVGEVEVPLQSEDSREEAIWTAGAKPFGIFRNRGRTEMMVTALNYLVVPSDWEPRLVAVDTVGGKDLSTADPIWITHIRNHLPVYYDNGPGALGGCWYCQQLKTWEMESVRSQGREFLKSKSSTCIRSQGGGSEKGGTPHGH